MRKENTEARLNRINKTLAKNVRHFSSMLEDVAKNIVPAELVNLQRQLVLDLLSRVVLKTPVDTGRARGNWQVEVGNLPAGVVETTQGPSEIIEAGMKKLASLGFGQIVWVANNLEYVTFLEDGSSAQAPRGMLSLSLAELETIFQ